MPVPNELSATSPVSVGTGEDGRVEEGMALCLSGGGYRAMLFHVGALWRLNELGYLPKLDRVSSVSGGSITAATLGRHWPAARFDDDWRRAGVPATQVVRPCAARRRRRSTPARSSAGSSRPGRIDRRQGRRRLPQAPVRRRHAAGASGPPALRHQRDQHADGQPVAVLEALHGRLPDRRVPEPARRRWPSRSPRRPRSRRCSRRSGCRSIRPGTRQHGRGPQHMPPYTSDVVLSDGGVYDNLGLETAWKRYRTVLVSDGGGQMAPRAEAHTALGAGTRSASTR